MIIVKCIWKSDEDYITVGNLYEAKYDELDISKISILISHGWWKEFDVNKFVVESGETAELRYRIRQLEHKLHNQKHELNCIQNSLRDKNLALDAMHYVWCDGGCTSGTHRWTPQNITKEIVLEAERNTRRLRSWRLNNISRNNSVINNKKWWNFWK